MRAQASAAANGKLSTVVYSAREARTARASDAAKKAAFHAGCQVFPWPCRYRPPEFSSSRKPRFQPKKREGVFRWGKNQVRENRASLADRSAHRQVHFEWGRVLFPALRRGN